jgi:hypothetical protein
LLRLALLGAPEGSRLVHVDLDLDDLTINLAITAPTAVCPLCRAVARRVRSRYTRPFADLPCIGRQVRLRITVRRCDAAGAGVEWARIAFEQKSGIRSLYDEFFQGCGAETKLFWPDLHPDAIYNYAYIVSFGVRGRKAYVTGA